MAKKKKDTLAHRAWNLLRMALLTARKCRALKRRLMVDLRLIASRLKGFGGGGHPYGELHHGERELSFDETPTFHFKVYRPRFPCIKPPIDLDDNDDDNNGVFYETCNQKSYFFQEEMKEEDKDNDDDDDEGEEQEIDSKAEKFIAKFYQQMKLQRQVSLLQYNEMLNRGKS